MSFDYKPGALPGYVFAGVLILVVLAVILFLVTWPVMWLINWLFASSFLLFIFGVSHLSFWQTFALMAVCGALFKSYNYPSSK